MEETQLNDLAIKALRQIKTNPDGCPMCDSGKLRDPDKAHWDTCGYLLMDIVLSCFCQRCGKRVGDAKGVWEGIHTCTPPKDVL